MHEQAENTNLWLDFADQIGSRTRHVMIAITDVS